MTKARTLLLVALLTAFCYYCVATAAESGDDGFVALFANEGAPAGWKVTLWSDVAKPGPPGAKWVVKEGILHGSSPRGTWLVSEREYGDFVLAFEFKLGPQGNSGVGLRFPAQGDPAFDGLEIQMADARYYGTQEHGPDQLTASLYDAIAPAKQVYKPDEWNALEVTCQGPRVKVVLNGAVVQDVNLDERDERPKRGAPLSERPRRGHVGFQELSRGNSQVQIRAAKIKEL
jgi:hypothetical protein